MTWWAWLLIWTGLALALIAVLVLGAIWLWRKLIRLSDDLGGLADQLTVLETADDLPPPAVIPAILLDPDQVRAARSARIARRLELKRTRRQDRLDRARRITSVDATKVRWPDAWYR